MNLRSSTALRVMSDSSTVGQQGGTVGQRNIKYCVINIRPAAVGNLPAQ